MLHCLYSFGVNLNLLTQTYPNCRVFSDLDYIFTYFSQLIGYLNVKLGGDRVSRVMFVGDLHFKSRPNTIYLNVRERCKWLYIEREPSSRQCQGDYPTLLPPERQCFC